MPLLLFILYSIVSLVIKYVPPLIETTRSERPRHSRHMLSYFLSLLGFTAPRPAPKKPRIVYSKFDTVSSWNIRFMGIRPDLLTPEDLEKMLLEAQRQLIQQNRSEAHVDLSFLSLGQDALLLTATIYEPPTSSSNASDMPRTSAVATPGGENVENPSSNGTAAKSSKSSRTPPPDPCSLISSSEGFHPARFARVLLDRGEEILAKEDHLGKILGSIAVEAPDRIQSVRLLSSSRAALIYARGGVVGLDPLPEGCLEVYIPNSALPSPMQLHTDQFVPCALLDGTRQELYCYGWVQRQGQQLLRLRMPLPVKPQLVRIMIERREIGPKAKGITVENLRGLGDVLALPKKIAEECHDCPDLISDLCTLIDIIGPQYQKNTFFSIGRQTQGLVTVAGEIKNFAAKSGRKHLGHWAETWLGPSIVKRSEGEEIPDYVPLAL